MKPRERTGQVSIANAAPAGHSAPHADAEERPEQKQEKEARRQSGEEVADPVPPDRDHQRCLAADPIGEPAIGTQPIRPYG
jgi:hypothetical protein